MDRTVTPQPSPATFSVSVIVPAFDEADRLAATLAALQRALEPVWPGAFELVVVDDGSSDATLEVALRAADRLPRCTVVSYAGNRGKGYALRRGFAAARGDVVAFFDADGEVAAEEVVPMLLEAQRGVSVVVGRRRWLARRPLLRRVASRIVSFTAATVFRLEVPESQAGIKAFVRADVESPVRACREDGFLFDLELLVRARREGLVMTSVDVTTTVVRPCRIGLGAGARELARLTRLWWRLGRRSVGDAVRGVDTPVPAGHVLRPRSAGAHHVRQADGSAQPLLARARGSYEDAA